MTEEVWRHALHYLDTYRFVLFYRIIYHWPFVSHAVGFVFPQGDPGKKSTRPH